MIDGVKIVFFNKFFEDVLASLGIEISDRKTDGGGTLKCCKATHHNLHITIYPSGRIEIAGSLHKYWKRENHSDFSFKELCECISDLCQKFNIDPLEARVHNLEFGVNVSPLFNPFEFCDNVIAYWDGKRPFKEMDEGETVIGFTCERTEYDIKIYDKGRQYKKEVNILRFEQRAKIEMLGHILNKTFANLIIADIVDTTQLSKKDLEIYRRCNNSKEWGKMERWERVRLKKEFKLIIDTYGKNQWIDPTAKMIDEKWRMLLVLNTQTANVLTNSLNPIQIDDCKRSHHFGKVGECSTPPATQRFCKTCGRDISDQKGNSRFCSARLVGEKQAHKCRNMDSNKRNNFLNREKKMYGDQLLFEVKTLLRPDSPNSS